MILPLFAAAKVHYAKVEPYESISLKSAVSAEVLSVNLEAEGTMVKEGRIIHLDDRLDKADLNASIESLELFSDMLDIKQSMLKNLEESARRQKAHYERMSRLSTASKTQKDSAFNTFVSAETQYLSTKESIRSLKKQTLDMEYKVQRLRDSIEKKNITLENKYLYSLAVRAGDFVNPGTPLATVMDLSRGKLTLYLDPSELPGAREKKVYIDGRETDYKIDRIWSVSDKKFISSYKAEIYIDKPEGYFSRLVKVELK
jgi:multidrug resistance efflux pump